MIYMLKSILYGEGIEILQDDQCYKIEKQRMLKFINEWCMLYGSTYDGRRKACAIRMHIQQKVPILISERTRDIIFPIKRVLSQDGIWINYRGIDDYKRCGNQTIITFHNDRQIKIALEYRAIQREMFICEQYLAMLEDSPR